MNRIDRLFGILTMLQSKKYVPAEQIAEKFRISIRTVYRDVKALCEQGIPVSFEAQRGYFVVQGYFLPPVSFTQDEANALLLMERMASGFADRSVHGYYASALQKVKAVLRGKDKDRLEQLDQSTACQLPDCVRADYEFISPIQQAISGKTVVMIDYKNKKEEVSKRRIEPIGLIFYAFSWHVVGWCHLREDYRDFKVSRILKVQDTGVAFTQATHISLNDYMKSLPVAY